MSTPDRIAAARAELTRRLAVCEAASAGPWRAHDPLVEADGCFFDIGAGTEHDVALIASSRNQRPGELRCLLALLADVETHAITDSYEAQCVSAGVMTDGGQGWAIRDRAEHNAALRTLSTIETMLEATR